VINVRAFIKTQSNARRQRGKSAINTPEQLHYPRSTHTGPINQQGGTELETIAGLPQNMKTSLEVFI
jgi:hypothetical protein